MNNSKKIRVDLLLCESYLRSIENSLGSRLFRNLLAKVNGAKQDILRDGALSCAVFVSSILVLFGLIKKRHANVDSTVRSMLKAGWREIKAPKRGAVLVWGERDFGKGSVHKHIGFYAGNKEAISNSYLKKVPVRHHWKSAKLGPLEKILWHDKLTAVAARGRAK